MLQKYRSCISVAMAIYACFKRIFQMFHFFQTYVANISSGCFKCKSRRAHVAMASIVSEQQHATDAYCCYWGWRRGSPCGSLRPTNASAGGAGLVGPMWGLGMGARAQCGVHMQGHWHWMGCRLRLWDAVRDNTWELRPDTPSIRTSRHWPFGTNYELRKNYLTVLHTTGHFCKR
jgi:hypothetical protein